MARKKTLRVREFQISIEDTDKDPDTDADMSGMDGPEAGGDESEEEDPSITDESTDEGQKEDAEKEVTGTKRGRQKGQSYRSSYSSQTLKKAYQAVVGEGMAVYAAAKKYGVPQSTLRDRVLGRISADVTSSGPPTIFTAEEEASIADYIKLFADIGHPLSRNKVREMAGNLASHLNRRGFTDGKILSLRWYYKLMEKFPQMQCTKFAHAKLQEVHYGYYKTLEKTLKMYELNGRPQLIYNLDQLCVSTEESSSLKLICRKTGQGHTVIQNTEARISFLGCANASGKKIPPCYVFASSGDNPSRKTIGKILHGTMVKYSPTGQCTAQILSDYFEYCFSVNVKVGPKSKKQVLLFYDSARLEIPFSVWIWGQNNHVLFFPLPNLDEVRPGFLSGIMPVYETEQRSFCEKNPSSSFTSTEACKILSRAYSHLQPEHFEATFKSLRVFPLPVTSNTLVHWDYLLEEIQKRKKKNRRRRAKRQYHATESDTETIPSKHQRRGKGKAPAVSKQKSCQRIQSVETNYSNAGILPVDWSDICAASKSDQQEMSLGLQEQADALPVDPTARDSDKACLQKEEVTDDGDGSLVEGVSFADFQDGDKAICQGAVTGYHNTFQVYAHEGVVGHMEGTEVLVAQEVIIG